ncbi:HAMP domain-containing sensor histidine kinase [Methylorubrum extorquens]|uniref:histidine kinase n=1 Tax=Methylorubrum extorquens (strain CM4 / NCIMB 13688) TaxID=440085 RepID=B7L2Y8_METC4|nr:histidine kinase [Methylorubrum extorquens]ACK86196.1 histidine kinase [Methylorubrum extorquens CM4]
MILLIGLVLRVMAVVALCVTGATAWMVLEVHRGIHDEAVGSADRVVREAQELAWRELTWRGSAGRYAKYAFPDWRSSHTLRFISPGNCVALTWEGEATQTQCSGLETAGGPAPAWFEALHRSLLGPSEPVRRSITLNRREAGTVVATPDPGAMVRQVWRQVRILVGTASAMAICIGLLATVVIGWTLRPAAVITRVLARLEQGDLAARLPRLRSGEFDRIARAVNALGHRLERSTAERKVLTQRLFQVQEEERRTLARELHDEFGQCLTATGALAAAIEAGAPDRPDLHEDARAISRITRQMMQTLREALAHLRPPDLEEFGLQRALQRLVATWQRRETPTLRLAVDGNLSGVPGPVALSLYRVVQECLTNAVRHGRPTDVSVHLGVSVDAVTVIVRDDGGGVPGDIIGAEGHGLLGMRERVEALGGRLWIGSAGSGFGIEAIIPIAGHALERSVHPPAHPASVERGEVSGSLERVAA